MIHPALCFVTCPQRGVRVHVLGVISQGWATQLSRASSRAKMGGGMRQD